MLMDVLENKINAMSSLRQRENRITNKAAQDAVDTRFKTLTEDIHKLTLALQYTKANMSFQLSDSTLNGFDNLLTDAKETVRSGFAEKDAVNTAEKALKDINAIVKKEWSKQYDSLTSAAIGTLKVVIDIDKDRVTACLDGIGKGATWTTNVEEYAAMNKSLNDAVTLIAELGLDDQIIDFLQKMSGGKATVADLDEKVLNWLRSESLEKRVKLSFGMSTGKRI